jgi:tripartite-type tricarboxylate transporter receptor subunit TctC
MKARLWNLFFLWIILIFFFPRLGYSQEEIAQFPSRPINFIIALPPGAGLDLACRLICKEAEKYLGQTIIPVNKPGGTFAIGTAAIASAKPDGYTIGCAGYPAMFVVSQIEKVPFHTLKDFKWIMQFGYMNFGVTVKGDSPFKSLKDLIDYARQNPNKLINGCGGIGGFGHILMEQVARKEGVRITHMPFKGGPDTEKALLGGHIHLMTGDVNFSLLEAGEIRLLALLAENRSIDYPQTPILKDLGYDIPAPTILMVSAPKGIPEGIAKKLEEAFTNAMKDQVFIRGMRNIRFTIIHRNSKELEDYVSYNYEVFTKLVKEMGLAK